MISLSKFIDGNELMMLNVMIVSARLQAYTDIDLTFTSAPNPTVACLFFFVFFCLFFFVCFFCFFFHSALIVLTLNFRLKFFFYA